MPSRGDVVLISAGAVLLTLAYPPFHLVWPAFVCLVPAALLILRGTHRPEPLRWRLHIGFWYGAVTHGVLLHWLAQALVPHGLWALWLYAAAAMMFGVATAVMFAVVGRIADASHSRFAVALPAGVVLLEWIAGQLGPIALPWHQMALTVTSTPVLVQFADVAGAGGLSFILAAINGLIALAWSGRGSPRLSSRRLEAAATMLLFLLLYGAHRLETVPLEVAGSIGLVQPNASVEEKWRPDRVDAVFERTIRLTHLALAESRPDMIVWPETALTVPIESRAAWRDRITQLARKAHVSVVTGGVSNSPSRGNIGRSNIALGIEPGRSFTEAVPVLHRKTKLVPFVERVRWRGVDVSLGHGEGFEPGDEVVVTAGPMGRFGTLICYEMTFDVLPRTLRRGGAELLVVLSNDAWLGRGGAPTQHFAHGILRAVENRMTVVRSANTGISGIIDPLGRVVTRTEPFEEAFAIGEVDRTTVVPLAVRLGGLSGPAAGVLLLTLLLFGTGGSMRSKPAEIARHGSSKAGRSGRENPRAGGPGHRRRPPLNSPPPPSAYEMLSSAARLDSWLRPRIT